MKRVWSTAIGAGVQKHWSFLAACPPQHRARAACRAFSKFPRQVLHEPRGGVKWCEIGTSPLGYLPEFAAVRAQSTPHGPRPGPALALWCTRWSPVCPAAESRRKDPGPEEKEMRKCEIGRFGTWYISGNRVHSLTPPPPSPPSFPPLPPSSSPPPPAGAPSLPLPPLHLPLSIQVGNADGAPAADQPRARAQVGDGGVPRGEACVGVRSRVGGREELKEL